MKRLILIVVLLCSLRPLAAQCTCAAGYTWFRTITIDKTKVPNTDRTNFPVLISSTIADLKTTGNGGDVTDAQGDDIIVANTSGTKLDHEVEIYTATTGLWTAHVEFPTVATATDTVGCLNYANSGVTTSQQNATGVWDANYKSVWHLSDASSPALDSTANNVDGTQAGGVTFGATGQIGLAVSLDGVDNVLDFGDQAVYDGATQVTVEAWIKPNASTPSTSNYVGQYAESGDHGIFVGHLAADETSVLLAFRNAAAVPYAYSGTGVLSASVFKHVVAVYDGTQAVANDRVKLWVDGAAISLTHVGTHPTTLGDANAALRIGKIGSGAPTWWQGIGDETRMSTSVRSADWIVTSFNSQSSPSTFYAIGNETSCAASGRPSGLRLRGVGD